MLIRTRTDIVEEVDPGRWSQWVSEGARLLAVPPLRRSEQASRGPDDPKFELGDFLTQVPECYVETLAESCGTEPSKFRIYREVAELVPPGARVKASWTVHRDLRRQPDLLRDGLTVREAAQLLGKQPIDSKADRRLTLEERAARVRAALADRDVFELIDGELGASRVERQVRNRARQVHTEYGKRARDLEAEVRRLRDAKSPFEATVKAELEINRALQLVEAVGASIDDLPEHDRLLRALDELNTVIAAVLLKHRGENVSLGDVIIVDGEVW